MGTVKTHFLCVGCWTRLAAIELETFKLFVFDVAIIGFKRHEPCKCTLTKDVLYNLQLDTFLLPEVVSYASSSSKCSAHSHWVVNVTTIGLSSTVPQVPEGKGVQREHNSIPCDERRKRKAQTVSLPPSKHIATKKSEKNPILRCNRCVGWEFLGLSIWIEPEGRSKEKLFCDTSGSFNVPSG